MTALSACAAKMWVELTARQFGLVEDFLKVESMVWLG